MGIVSNFTVYGLMVLPIAMMIRGHGIHFPRIIKLALLCVVIQLTESLLIGAAPSSVALATVVHGLVMPLVQAVFFTFALRDPKASKTLKLRDAGDGDRAAVIATVWCLTYTVLYRWITWYHTMSSLGYEMNNLISAAEAFLSVVSSLAVARLAQGGSEEGSHTADAGSSFGPLALVFGAVAVGTVITLAVPSMPLAGAAVTTAVLVAMPKKSADGKKQN